MTRSIRTIHLLLAVFALMAVSAARPGVASAACFAAPDAARLSPQRLPANPGKPAIRNVSQSVHTGPEHLVTIGDGGSPSASVVGMWRTVLLLGDGPERFDEAFQQFHSDGTETMLSDGLPPVLGNVCLGIWKQTGGRSLKVKHMAWNWEANGAFAGTFVMEAELRLSRDGRTFAGSWTADSYDAQGALIPAMHTEGVARGRRISID
jgi:hypothetical protein